LDPVLLWPGGAPGALGDSAEDKPRLTAFLPEAGAPTAAVVVCPGGGYEGRAEHEREPIARWLAGLGVAGLLLDYRVRPYRHPIPLTDAQRAIRLARANASAWNIDPGRVGVLGFSAGGHLACSVATQFDAGNPAAADAIDRQPCRPDALIACYAVVTMFGPAGYGLCADNLLGSGFDDVDLMGVSVENHVTPETPPTFIWQTADDNCVRLGQALLLAEALARHHVPLAMHIFPHGRHGLGLATGEPAVAKWADLCADWLKHIGFRAS
jgi:acetyl esterase/lipase